MPEGLLAVALAAGMLAAVNPCGFALLPAYLSLLILGEDDPGRGRALLRAVRLTAAMTLGFTAVFGFFGLAVAPFAAGVQRYLPWFTVLLGLSLVAIGALLVAGRPIRLPRLRRRGRTATPLTSSFGSMAGFGASYALASLTCTVAPFLAVVVGGFRAESAWVGITLFVAYALGMGLVVGTVAVATALASGAVVRTLRRAGGGMARAGGALVLLAGAYVAYYGWWELRVLRGGEASDLVVDTAAQVQARLAGVVVDLGASGWLLLAAGLLGAAWSVRAGLRLWQLRTQRG